MGSHFPTITILTLSYNPPAELFEKSLRSIAFQEYPKENIEHIILDGGSQQETIELAKKYGCTILVKKDYLNDSEGRRAFGIHAANYDIILWLETDNILPHKKALQELIRPFLHDPRIIASYSLHYNYNSAMSRLDRYCALFGASDPVAMYLGKADREPWFYHHTTKGRILSSNQYYDTVIFTKESLPTLGDNGFAVRRDILLKTIITPQNYFHTDIFIDLIRSGYNRFAVVTSTATENYVDTNLHHLISRRMFYMQRDGSSQSLSRRRYAIFDPKKKRDVFYLLLFCFYTVTFVQPLLLSIRGFLLIKDTAWFMHPIVCWYYLIGYTKVRTKAFFSTN